MKAYSQRYEAALTLAAQAHRGQLRKVGDVPYIVHPVHVATILLRYRFSEDTIIAGLLHDVVEDQDIPLSRLEADFGPTVAGIVAALTERKYEAGPQYSWEARKQEMLDRIRRASKQVVAVKAADTLHSTRALTYDLCQKGPSIWSNFSRGPAASLQYYRSVAAVVRERLGTHPLAQELDEAIDSLARAIAATETD